MHEEPFIAIVTTVAEPLARGEAMQPKDIVKAGKGGLWRPIPEAWVGAPYRPELHCTVARPRNP